MIDIGIKNMSKSYFSRNIFDDINIELQKGEVIGLLGENGTGKTTIFNIIVGNEIANSGDLFVRKGLKIGYLKQIPSDYSSLTVREVLIESFKKSYNELDKYVFEKMSKICDALKFDDEILEKKYRVLSGGEKTKIELGKLLLEEPDILLLDEPTNHLDIATSEWFESYLKKYNGSVLIISHDRYFLDNLVCKIYELSMGTTEIYMGNYSYYIEERSIRYENRLKEYNVQQRKIKQLEEAVRRFRDWGERGDNPQMFAKVRATEKRIERMRDLDKPIKDTKAIKLQFAGEDRSANEVIKLNEYNLSIGNLELVKSAEFTIYYKDRVGLIGANGSGKSTLIKEILQFGSPENKKIKIGSRSKIGYLEQDINFKNEEMTVIETFKSFWPISDGLIRNYIAGFKFYSDDVFKKVKNLSGGERVRLMLSILMKDDINLLILDEPTNHIDIKTKEVLEDALETFEGTILFISHDRFFLNKMANRILEIEEKTVTVYEGNYEYYKEEKQNKIKISADEVVDKRDNKNSSAKKPKKVNQIKIDILEKEILNLESRISTMKEELANPETEYKNLQSIMDEIKILEVELEVCMEKYYSYL